MQLRGTRPGLFLLAVATPATFVFERPLQGLWENSDV